MQVLCQEAGFQEAHFKRIVIRTPLEFCPVWASHGFFEFPVTLIIISTYGRFQIIKKIRKKKILAVENGERKIQKNGKKLQEISNKNNNKKMIIKSVPAVNFQDAKLITDIC
jgi:hypothetical protein